MKKVMFVVVILVVASTSCFAQMVSGPSNTVGYVKIVAPGNAAPGVQTVSTPFGLAFKFWVVPAGGIPTYGSESTYPRDIAGDQTFCGTTSLNTDRILRQGAEGYNAYRLTTLGCGWTGSLETNANQLDRMAPGYAYWYQNRTDADRNFVTAGEVVNTGVDGNTYVGRLINNNQFNAYSWRDSRDMPRDQLGLMQDGFSGGTSSLNADRVVIQDGTGNNFWYSNTLSAWQGMAGIIAGQAYWIHNRNHANGAWTYDYNANGAGLATIPTTPVSKDVPAGTITKVNSPSKVQTGKGSARQ